MNSVYHYPHPFTTEGGYTFSSLDIAYHTFGTLNADKSNVIWVCHALTANSDVADWWPHTVEAGRFLDPDKYFTVCANFLGSHYGTTGPLSINPQTGEPWYGDFPKITVRDMVRVHQLLAAHLGIDRVAVLVGSSIGGFQAIEWAVMQPEFAHKAIFIATAPRTKAWVAGFNESQRMAMELDATFGERRADAGLEGMSVARSLALLSYRGGVAYNVAQEDVEPDSASFERRVHSYQRYQGKKLKDRFNAYSYYRLSQAVDSHNVGRERGRVEDVLKGITAKTLVVAITSDILFSPEEHQILVDNIPNVDFHTIDSIFGHDGFLVEYEKLNEIILDFI